MSKYLITGPSGFLAYHVIKLLNGRGIKPRTLVPPDADTSTPAFRSLQQLDVERVTGNVEDLPSLRAACDGIDIVLHLNFLIQLGGGTEVEQKLRAVNVVGTSNLIAAAAQAGATRVVVSSSALTVGLNRQAKPLDETADWNAHGFHLPYALSRREAEQQSLARTESTPVVVVVNPSFTAGPEDFVGAPANKLLMKMTKPSFRITAPIGFGVLDARDYADGVLRAAQSGRHGQRYILSGENVMADQLAREVATVVGRKPPGWLFTVRHWMAWPLVTALETWSRLRRKPPKVTRSLLELWNRHAWYDTSLARRDLGWSPRPLRDTLRDTIEWMRQNGKG